MICRNLDTITDNIEKACTRNGRETNSVKLQGISKKVSVELIKKAISCGLRFVGESKVQEASAKAKEGAYEGANLALVGHLQSNKASLAARVFDQVHSVDSVRIASLLSKYRLSYKGREEPLGIMVQVNIDKDPAKYGFAPEEVEEAVVQILEMPGLRLTGLMTVPSGYGDPDLARDAYRRLRILSRTLVKNGCPIHNLQELSMGMSGDYIIAVEEGSTLVRVGTRLFGERR